MCKELPILYLARHGETAWSISGQHTGRTDIPLTERGERNAARLGERVKGLTFDKVFCSPLQRARRTCELAGFGSAAEIDAKLLEWDYGQYEGLRSAEIHAKTPDWQLFRDGCPAGNLHRTWLQEPIRSLTGLEASRETYCCSQADISCGCSQRGGWICRRMVAGYSR
jgi:broad specificity phosphatase PhoE